MRLWLLLSLALLAVSVASGDREVSWRKTNPTVTSDDLTDIAFGNGIYVATGTRPTIFTSTDLQTWEAQELPYIVRDVLGEWSIAYGPEAGFVAVSIGRPTLVSKDGKHWKSFPQPYISYDVGVVYGNGVYVGPRAELSQPEVSVSKDGAKWAHHLVTTNQANLDGLAFFDGRFLAYGNDGFNTGAIYGSVDGQTWSVYRNISQTIPGTIWQIFGLQPGAGSTLVALIALTDSVAVVTSTDKGVTWKPTLISPGYALSGPVTYGNGVFFASVGDRKTNRQNTWVSFDNGQTWQPASTTLQPAALLPKFLNGRFVAVGPAGLIQTSPDGGRTFKPPIDEGILNTFVEFANTPSGYQVNGRSFFIETRNTTGDWWNRRPQFDLLASRDGVGWSSIASFQSPVTQMTFVESLQAWVGIMHDRLRMSKDLVNWHDLPSPTLTPPVYKGSSTLVSFAFSDGVWLALADYYDPWVPSPTTYSLYRSQGALPSANWTVVQQGNRAASQVVAANGAFLFSAASLMYSRDGGRSWQTVPSHPNVPPAVTASGSVYGIDKFLVSVAVDGSSVALSTDPESWRGFTFDDVPGALVKSAFQLDVDPSDKNRTVAVSLTDGSIRRFDASTGAWSVWSVIPRSYDGFEGVRRNAEGIYVAVNTLDQEIFTTVA